MKFLQERISWVLMAALGVMIIVIGIEGSLGKILGCIFTPGYITVNS